LKSLCLSISSVLHLATFISKYYDHYPSSYPVYPQLVHSQVEDLLVAVAVAVAVAFAVLFCFVLFCFVWVCSCFPFYAISHLYFLFFCSSPSSFFQLSYIRLSPPFFIWFFWGVTLHPSPAGGTSYQGRRASVRSSATSCRRGRTLFQRYCGGR